MQSIRNMKKSGFTLVEILIVVIILGILAAIVIPQFTGASQEARKNSLTSQLQTIRSQVELYKLQHRDNPPPLLVAGGATAWDNMTVKTNSAHSTTGTTADPANFGPYFQDIPKNPLNGFFEVAIVATDVTGGAAHGGTGATEPGFIYNTANGKVWGTSKSGANVYDEGNANNSNNDL
jgi:general secretion pathway protein G